MGEGEAPGGSKRCQWERGRGLAGERLKGGGQRKGERRVGVGVGGTRGSVEGVVDALESVCGGEC